MSEEKHQVWQRLVDEAHEIWRPLDVGMADLCMELSREQRIAFVLAKLNYQVENGGFLQWIDNGYSVLVRDTLWALEAVGTDNAKQIVELVKQAMQHEEEPEADDEFGYDERFEALHALDDKYYGLEGWVDEVEAALAAA